MDPIAVKDALREKIGIYRSGLSTAHSAQLNEKIQDFAEQKILDTLIPRQALACYVATPDEPDTHKLITNLAKLGFRILLPVLKAEPDWAWFESWEHMRVGWAGIAQPLADPLSKKSLSQVNLIIAPSLAIGRDGTRLGKGGGWYDRALLFRQRKCPIWCLNYQAEVFDTVPVSEHDQPVNAVITELGFFETTS